MNPLDKSLKRYLRPMVRSAETPRRLLTLKSVGHLRAAFLFNLLNFQCYELSDRPLFSSQSTEQQI